MKFTEEQILYALSQVEDPDFKKDLVTLNMIKDLSFTEDEIKFTIELTTPACPLKEQMENDSRNAIAQLVSSEVSVIIDFSSRVTTLRDVKSEILPNVKNIITVASGKGGVGKSTVSVNLALALLRSGAKVGMIDADIYGPSLPTMLGLQNVRPEVKKVEEKNKIIPVDYLGMPVMSIGFLIQDKQPVAWRGPMATSALRQIITEVLWEDLDYLVIDLPPGTGDIQLTLAQKIPVTGAVIVTTPQDIALLDARKGLKMFEKVGIPILGIVENMSVHICSNCGHTEPIFGSGGGEKMCSDYGVSLLGQLPLDMGIRLSADSGKPTVAAEPDGKIAAIYKQIARKVAVKVGEKAQDHSAKFPKIVIQNT